MKELILIITGIILTGVVIHYYPPGLSVGSALLMMLVGGFIVVSIWTMIGGIIFDSDNKKN